MGEARDVALAELARRYMSGHGPATAGDLAKWAGLPLRDARIGLRAIGAELVEYEGGLLGRSPGGVRAQEQIRRVAGEVLPPEGFGVSALGTGRTSAIRPRDLEV